jgi:hypothetical protein
MEDFEEALRNIDVFCRTVVKKIVENENSSPNIAVEPIENLLRKKYVMEEKLESIPSTRYLILLAEAEEPLVDIFEDGDYMKIFLQHHCQGKDVKIHTDIDGIEICLDECKKLNLPVKHLKIANMTVKCGNNRVLEIGIPKTETAVSYSNQF